MKSDMLQSVIVLVSICAVSALLVTGVYIITREKVIQNEKSVEMNALKEVLREGDSIASTIEPFAYFRISDNGGKEEIAVIDEGQKTSDSGIVYIGKTDSKIIGYATTGTGQGYSSEILAMVAVSDDLTKLLRVAIISQQETPGLGAKVAEEGEGAFLKQFENLKLPGRGPTPSPQGVNAFAGFEVVKGQEEGKISAITGATISSTAVTEAVNNGVRIILKAVEDKKRE